MKNVSNMRVWIDNKLVKGWVSREKPRKYIKQHKRVGKDCPYTKDELAAYKQNGLAGLAGQIRRNNPNLSLREVVDRIQWLKYKNKRN